jgi:membrane-associated phospholipid phosphatase
MRHMGGLAALTALLGSAWSVHSGVAGPIDARAREAIAGLRDPRRDDWVRVATDLGSLYGVGTVTGGLLAVGDRRASRVLAAGMCAWTLAQVTKRTFDRGRPYEVDGAERLVVIPAGSSWPSGHAAVAAAMADVLAAGRGPLTRSVAYSAAAAVGLSRIYVGVHHLSDVIAGFGVGVLSARMLRRSRRH